MKEENLYLDCRSVVIFALQFFIRQAKKKILIIIRKEKHNEDKNYVSHEYCNRVGSNLWLWWPAGQNRLPE